MTGEAFWTPASAGGFPDYTQSTAPGSPSSGEFWFDTSIHVLKYYDGAAWQWVGVDALSNVDTSGKADTDILEWDTTTSKWVDITKPSGGGGGSALNDLSDVTISAAAAGDFLVHDGSVFRNRLHPDARLFSPLTGSLDDDFLDESLSVDWSVVEDTSPNLTLTESGGVLNVEHPGGDASNEWHGVVKSIGATSAPITIEAAFRYTGAMAVNYHGFGLCFSDGTTWGTSDEIIHATFLDSGPPGPRFLRRYNNFNAYSADLVTVVNHYADNAGVWNVMRLTWEGSNSWGAGVGDMTNTVDWTSGRSNTLTPTHCGFAFTSFGSAEPFAVQIGYFKVT